jgi:protein TonB
MIRHPDVLPSSDMIRLKDPTVKQRVGIEGNKLLAEVSQRYGLPDGAENGGDGPGTGGAIGTGRDQGVGPGSGNSLGPGRNGEYVGSPDREAPPPIEKVTSPLKIISKPKAPYTDEARQRMVMGSVTLRITFLASGQIGAITAVTRLPYGLTENAIAAAKLIKFEPKKVNGIAVPVTMTFEYGFNIF